MGRQRPPNEKPRPIKIIMPCSAAATEAIRNKKKLSGGKFKNVIIRRSLTKEELEERASLIESTKTNQKSSLSCLYYNCQSIKNKIHELDLEISQQNPDILFLTETWINSSENPLLYLKSASLFQIITENRNQSYKSRGGGVAMLIRNGISFRHIKCKKIAGIDTLIIDVSTTRFKYYIRYNSTRIKKLVSSSQGIHKFMKRFTKGHSPIPYLEHNGLYTFEDKAKCDLFAKAFAPSFSN
uniref:Endonuclease/exonuclease/phosphatase domain-containing protein n=1 Tax=Meloidogyne floridensis TaxID=298350 RepID=A0A915NPU8_9BILA